MDKNENFTRLYKKFCLKVYLRSFLKGLIYCLPLLIVLTTITCIVNYKYFWISFIIFAVVMLITTSILFIVEKPKEKEFMKNIDDVGLQQRAITMYQYKDDNSLIARLQRENAETKINEVDAKSFKIKTPIWLYAFAITLSVFAIVTTVFSSLVSTNKLPSLVDRIKVNNVEEKKVYEVEYKVEGKGKIEGELAQKITSGDNATGVLAVAEDGWFFEKWVSVRDSINLNYYDNVNTKNSPYRLDTNVESDLTIVAVFMKIDEKQADDDEEDDPLKNAPQPPMVNSQPGDGDNPGQLEGDSSNSNDGTGGSGGRYEESNQVDDGKTYYGDEKFANAYDDAMNSIQNDDEMSEDMKEIIKKYYDTIKK